MPLGLLHIGVAPFLLNSQPDAISGTATVRLRDHEQWLTVKIAPVGSLIADHRMRVPLVGQAAATLQARLDTHLLCSDSVGKWVVLQLWGYFWANPTR